MSHVGRITLRNQDNQDKFIRGQFEFVVVVVVVVVVGGGGGGGDVLGITVNLMRCRC